MSKFYYQDQFKAMQDLRIFSNMNCNENRTLYLICVAGNYSIENTVPDVTQLVGIEAIALNGLVYTNQ